MAHHPAWVCHHTGGSRSKPTVHPCPLRWRGCGLLTNSTTHSNESKKTQHDNNMSHGIRVEYFCRIHHIAALLQSPRVLVKKMSEEPEDFTGRIIFMSMFNDISWGSKDNEQECELSAKLVSILRKDFHQEDGHSSDLIHESKPRREWDRVAELMMIKFSESGHPVFRSTSPFSRGVLKSKGGGTLSMHFYADGETVETVFPTIISVNQLSIYGAVSDLCE